MSALPELGDLVDGKYRIDREIGRGGMAVVFAATQILARREVAVKWLQPQIARSEVVVARFLREAQAAARIDHPSIVSVLDVGRWGSGFYLVMERLVGETLRERLEREGKLDLADALSIGGAVLGGVAAAHRAGVVHRDIKPENVFLRKDERGRSRGTKLLDFGISKLTEEESLTLTGQHLGTCYYLAPEQAEGGGGSSVRIDVYQVGVLLYEMLSGRRPYEGDSYGAIIVALMTTKPISLAVLRPDLPSGLALSIDRAMSRDPAVRQPDAVALARDLAPFGARFDEETERALREEAHTETMPVVSAPLSMPPVSMPPVSTPPVSTPPVSTPPSAERPSRSLPPRRSSPAPLAPAKRRVLPWVLATIGLAGVASVVTFGILAWLDQPGVAPVALPVAAASPPEGAAIADAGEAPVGSLPLGVDLPPEPLDANDVDAGTIEVAPPVEAAEPGERARRRVRPHVSADEF